MSGPDALRREGDPPGFQGVYERHFRRIYNFVRYMVRGRGEAEDLTATVFEKALRGWAGYRPERGAVEDWLLAIARNAVRDHARRAAARPGVSLEAVAEPASHAEGPEGSLMARERLAEVLRAVSLLPPREREMVALRFGGGLSNRAAAAVCGVTEGHAAVILHRAVRRLRGSLLDGEVP